MGDDRRIDPVVPDSSEVGLTTDLKLGRCRTPSPAYPRDFAFYVADPFSSHSRMARSFLDGNALIASMKSAETSTRAACAPQIIPQNIKIRPRRCGFVLIRRDLTEHRLSVLTPADEIQLGAAFFACVCDSYLLVRCNRIRIGCNSRCAGHC